MQQMQQDGYNQQIPDSVKEYLKKYIIENAKEEAKKERKKAIWNSLIGIFLFLLFGVVVPILSLVMPIECSYVVKKDSITQVDYYIFQTRVTVYEIDYGTINSQQYWKMAESNRPDVYLRLKSSMKGFESICDGERYVQAGERVVNLDDLLDEDNSICILKHSIGRISDWGDLFNKRWENTIVDFEYFGIEE